MGVLVYGRFFFLTTVILYTITKEQKSDGRVDGSS